jgi:hypothetical protein
MTRVASGDTVTVAASSNVYTALLGATCLVVLLGTVVLFLRAKALGVEFF